MNLLGKLFAIGCMAVSAFFGCNAPRDHVVEQHQARQTQMAEALEEYYESDPDYAEDLAKIMGIEIEHESVDASSPNVPEEPTVSEKIHQYVQQYGDLSPYSSSYKEVVLDFMEEGGYKVRLSASTRNLSIKLFMPYERDVTSLTNIDPEDISRALERNIIEYSDLRLDDEVDAVYIWRGGDVIFYVRDHTNAEEYEILPKQEDDYADELSRIVHNLGLEK